MPPRGATRVAHEVLDVGVFLWSSARASLRRFFFIRLVGRVVPSTRSSCFQSSSSGRHRARSAMRSSTPSMGTRGPRLRAPPAGRSRGRRGTVTALFVVLPLRGAAALDPRPRKRLARKTSVSQLQDAHEPAETCDARYPGRDDVYRECDCASAPRELLQNEIALLRVQLGPTEPRARTASVTPSAVRFARGCS